MRCVFALWSMVACSATPAKVSDAPGAPVLRPDLAELRGDPTPAGSAPSAGSSSVVASSPIASGVTSTLGGAPVPSALANCEHWTPPAELAPLGDGRPPDWTELDPTPGKRLPVTRTDSEVFRLPLRWPAGGSPSVIGFEQPGNAAGLVFLWGDCVLNTWYYVFGGNGVELSVGQPLHLASAPFSALLLVHADGWLRGYCPRIPVPEQASQDEEYEGGCVPTAQHFRSLVFLIEQRIEQPMGERIEQRSVKIVADSDLNQAGGFGELRRKGDRILLGARDPDSHATWTYNAKTQRFE